MIHTPEISKMILDKLNGGCMVPFEDTSCDYDTCDCACGEYDGVIIQVCFPNPLLNIKYFHLYTTSILLAEPTVQFKNQVGSSDLTLEEVLIESLSRGEILLAVNCLC